MWFPLLLGACTGEISLPIYTRDLPGSSTTVPRPTAPDPEPDLRGDWLFDLAIARTVAIHLLPDSEAALRTDPFGWVVASVTIGEVTVDDIGVRLKGNGSFRALPGKASLKIDTDRFVPGQSIDGLDEFVLNNGVTDPTGLRERTAYQVYRALGVPAPRATHAEVTVNGNPMGLYTLVEAVDGRFLDRWFADDEGPLFEMFDVELTADDVASFDHDGGPDDRSALMALAQVLDDPTSRLTTDAADLLDIDAFVQYFAVSGLIGQFDAYPYSFPGDDLYLYVDPTDGRLRPIPHGADETFNDDRRPVDYVFGALAKRCLEDIACDAAFVGASWEALESLEALDVLGTLDTLEELTAEAQARDPLQPYLAEEIADSRGEMRAFLRTRRDRFEVMPGLQ